MNKVLLAVLGTVLIIVAIPVGCGLQWFGKAASVVSDEIDPRTILDRYEWYIKTWENVQQYDATLHAYKFDREQYRAEYGEDRLQWPSDVRRELSNRDRTIRGILAQRNRLAAMYRDRMTRVNYKPAQMLPYFPETIPDYIIQ